MKRTLLTGILALATGFSALMAQAQPAKPPAGQAAAPGAAPQGAAAQGPTQASLVQALGSAQQAGDDNAIIKAAEELLTRFPNSPAKEAAYALEAAAYQNKNDIDSARLKWEEVLKIDPKSPDANLKIGEIIAGGIKQHDLDKDEKIAEATKYLATAADLIQNGAKPNPNLTDEQWATLKKELDAERRHALGMMYLNIAGQAPAASADEDTKKKFNDSVAKAIQELQTAVSEDPTRSLYGARLAVAYMQSGKFADAVAQCDKVLADPQIDPPVKTYVTNLKAQATKAQQAAAPAAK